jgi:hypothetical protein
MQVRRPRWPRGASGVHRPRPTIRPERDGSGDGLALRPSGIIGSILGAVVLLAAWQAIRGPSRGRSR